MLMDCLAVRALPIFLNEHARLQPQGVSTPSAPVAIATVTLRQSPRILCAPATFALSESTERS